MKDDPSSAFKAFFFFSCSAKYKIKVKENSGKKSNPTTSQLIPK